MNHYNVKHWMFILIFCLLQNSCVPFLVGIAVTTGTIATIQDRSIGNTIDDTAILIRINKDLLKAGLFSHVKVKVNEGRVLLIGSVSTHEKQLEAERIAWLQQGVKEVINEINISQTTQKNYLKLKDIALDTLISTQIKTQIIAENNIRSINYSVNTINGTVYLMGIAQDKNELNQIANIARKTRGVKQVVSYVRLKDSKLRN